MAGCRHPDIQRFDDIRCCLSCGEAIFEASPESQATLDNSLSSSYRYKPLKHGLGQEIRLIVLFAGKFSDELFCDMVTVNLADRPVYEAVSYTWADVEGNASLTSRVICGGKEIKVTQNCEEALRRLRLQSRSRRLWVDAICINQNNVLEKNHQVGLMSKIYTNCSQVLAYLGVNPNKVTTGLRRILNVLEHEQSRTCREIPDEMSTKTDLMEFLELPYFDRVWILQEIGLSRLVMFIVGAYEVRWTGATSSRMLNLCSAYRIQAPSILRWNPASRPEEENDVLAVLSKSRNCSATDPRDKVYALLGLMYQRFSTQFPVDYSLTPSEVFTKLAIYCIDGMGQFDVLRHCHDTPSVCSDTRTPTWVPNWEMKGVYELLPTQFSESDKHRFASLWHMRQSFSGNTHKSVFPFELPGRHMIETVLGYFTSGPDATFHHVNLSTAACRVQVRKWSEMQSIHKPEWAMSSGNIEHLAQHIVYQQSKNFAYKILDRDAWHSTDASMLTSSLLCLKLRAHRLDEITRVLGRTSNTRRFHILQDALPALGFYYCQDCIDAKVSLLQADSLERERKQMNLSIQMHGVEQTTFFTNHSVGFTRAKFQLEDSVWALYGAEVPFILREVENHYILVGECYLHRAGRPFPCKCCGSDAMPWPMQTEIIDIW